MGWRDEWPSMSDGNQYDGKQLLHLVRTGNSPFHQVWDAKLLIREIEENVNVQVTDILTVDKGSNNYMSSCLLGFHLRASNRPDTVARLARGDVNMPDFDGFPIEKQAPEAQFEAAVCELLHPESDIRASRLLYHRVPLQHPGPRLAIPQDLTSHRIFVFERAEGVNNLVLLDRLAYMRAVLFRYDPPLDFAAQYLHDRSFDFKPESLFRPVAPTREFGMHVLESRIKATIQNEGDMVGWEDEEETAGPIALAAKQSLLRAIPHIMLLEGTEVSLYRLVLDHGDFGIHDTSITSSVNGEPLVTSLCDWETAWIAPALLSDPLVAAGPADLIVDEDGRPSVTRLPENPTPIDLKHAEWARHYIKKLYNEAPDYEIAIRAGKDVRHLWFALRDWRGGDSEEVFGGLGAWAEKRCLNRVLFLSLSSFSTVDFSHEISVPTQLKISRE